MVTQEFIWRLAKIFVLIIIAGTVMGLISTNLVNQPAFAKLAETQIVRVHENQRVINKVPLYGTPTTSISTTE